MIACMVGNAAKIAAKPQRRNPGNRRFPAGQASHSSRGMPVASPASEWHRHFHERAEAGGWFARKTAIFESQICKKIRFCPKKANFRLIVSGFTPNSPPERPIL
jgi:hypothetical protein